MNVFYKYTIILLDRSDTLSTNISNILNYFFADIICKGKNQKLMLINLFKT